MTQPRSTLVRAVGGVASAALAVGALSFVAAAPAAAANLTVTQADIRLNEATYPGWHEGYNNALRAFSVRADGLHLGSGARSQVLYGLSADLPVTPTELQSFLQGMTVDATSLIDGVALQVAVKFGPSGWSTLRTNDNDGVALTDIWLSSKPIIVGGSTVIAADNEYPLSEILSALSDYATETSVPTRIVGFGVQSNEGSDAVVRSLTAGGNTYTFAAPATTSVTVKTADIKLTEAGNYTSWHEGYDNATPQFTVDAAGLHIGQGTSSQILKGLPTPESVTTDEFQTAIEGLAADVREGEASLQLAIEFGDPSLDLWSTLRASTNYGDEVDLTDLFESSKPIGAIAANDPVPLEDILTALNAQGDLVINGFGVQADGGDPSIVRSVTFDGVVYEFLEKPDVDRLAGIDRYATAVEISSAFAPGVDRLYVASGLNYADALSATPAAAHFDSPLLLSDPVALPEVIAEEIERLDPVEIVIVGGENSVSDAVLDAIEELVSSDVSRIAGIDRYETSRLIAADAFASADAAYLATGAKFPDALSAGPAAAHFDGPVILVDGSAATLNAATSTLLDDLGIEEIKIAGDASSVSAGIASQLAVDYDVVRNSGASRYETAVAINLDEFSSASKVYLATGLNFADALAGGALAAYDGAPLFVTPTDCVPLAVLSAFGDLGATEVVLLGGSGTLSAAVANLESCE